MKVAACAEHVCGRCRLLEDDGVLHVTALPVGTWVEDFLAHARKTFGDALLGVEDDERARVAGGVEIGHDSAN